MYVNNREFFYCQRWEIIEEIKEDSELPKLIVEVNDQIIKEHDEKNGKIQRKPERTEQLGFDFELEEFNECLELDKADTIFSVDAIGGMKIYSLIKK